MRPLPTLGSADAIRIEFARAQVLARVRRTNPGLPPNVAERSLSMGRGGSASDLPKFLEKKSGGPVTTGRILLDSLVGNCE